MTKTKMALSTSPELLELYQTLLAREEDTRLRGKNPPSAFHVYEAVAKISAPRLEEIKEFLVGSREFKDNPSAPYVLPQYITALVQNSYMAGNNNFELSIVGTASPIYKTSKGLDGLLSTTDFGGSERRPLVIVVRGDVGIDGGKNMSHVNLTINGNVGPGFGRYCEDSRFDINGKLGIAPGVLLGGSSISLEGSARCEYHLGKIRNRTVIDSVRNCTFTTPDAMTEDALRRYLPKGTGNRVNGALLE